MLLRFGIDQFSNPLPEPSSYLHSSILYSREQKSLISLQIPSHSLTLAKNAKVKKLKVKGCQGPSYKVEGYPGLKIKSEKVEN